MSPKIIAVTGATGTQGGGVVNVMRSVPGWAVRAVTRNPDSEAARKLAGEGIEVVQASFDDERSLTQAFHGAHAVFAVTNWWEPLFSGKSQDEASEIEERQGMNIARAAANTAIVEHYIWSTTPSAKKQLAVDYKAIVDDRIRAELPKLAAKTTYLYMGYYPQNMAYFPFLKPFKHVPNDQYIQLLPTKPDAKILVAGDMAVNPGIWVRQVLATGPKAWGKYANVALEKWTFEEMLKVWSEITGKPATFVECTMDSFKKLWGLPGVELALGLKYGELCDPWAERDGEFLTSQDLSIDEKEVVGFRGTIERLKDLF